MSARTSHWRLGAFVLVVAGAIIAAVIALGECSTHRRTTAFVTFFDESVAGLDSGARVVFRGVDVGSVARISIAPDHRHVQVTYGLATDALPRMGITAVSQDHGDRYVVPAELRAQIGGNGLTGVRNVAIDLFDTHEHPPPALPFAAPSNYIPATTSTMKNLEDAVTTAADRVPELVNNLSQASHRIDALLAEMDRAHLSDRAATTLAHADAALGALDVVVRRLDRAGVPEKTSQALGNATVALAKLNAILDGMSGSTRDVDDALEGLRDTAEAIRVLAEDLDRDPDMLLKGRAARRSR